ncbi:hypothetical protein HPP92_022642 [Vanilla planifolia]|uniref:Pentatricopeptide repeat-containing protein n=1 Tax=Vanilla planifolia TaxID=51239 RepID=A0A835PRW4_VANPL|nr:hypothetical protein HPP92_022642 [Vanilla planifolia]
MPRSAAKSSRPTTCLLESLHRCISAGRLVNAVAVLPLLARSGLRPPFRSLALLLNRSLRPPPCLHLARSVLLFLHLAGLKRLYPSHAFLSNHILHLHFLLGRPDHAQQLLLKMPQPNIFSYNAMLVGYARLGQVAPARHLFEKMPHRDLVSWNTFILVLARSGAAAEAVSVYSRLRCSGFSFNAHTLAALLIACVRLADNGLNLQVHGHVLISGFSSNVVISSLLLDAYAKGGFTDDARRVFDEMPVRDVFAWTAMVSAYAKVGNLSAAQRLFDVMPDRNPVSWTVLIGSYTRHGFAIEALELFRTMVSNGMQPDQFTFSSCLCASSAIASLKHGKQIHARLLRTRFNPNAIVLSSLIDMYSKCGDFEGCGRVFHNTSIRRRDVVIWNTVMSALGHHGHGREVIRLFEEMIRTGTRPDANTFVVLLTSCSHSGLVSEGLHFFESMHQQHGIVPEENHLVCLVDLLGRAGCFKEAMDWLCKEHYKSSSRAWKALLGACRIHGNSQLGKEIALLLGQLEPRSSDASVSLSNIYAEDGNWESVEKVRCLMEEKGLKKEQAASWVEVDNKIHSLGFFRK